MHAQDTALQFDGSNAEPGTAHLVVQTPCAWLVVPVIPDLYPSQRENFVVIGPGWRGNVNQLQRIVQGKELRSNLQHSKSKAWRSRFFDC